MANLQDFVFTLASDIAISSDGWTHADGVVNASLGDDSIAGQGGDIGVDVMAAILDGNLGNDSLSGSGTSYGLRNADCAIISMGLGDDLVSGEALSSDDGILNTTLSSLDTGLGDDRIIGQGSASGDGIRNSDHSLISTGLGNDSISGSGGVHGLHNETAAAISSGLGDDWISGSGALEEGIVNASDSCIDTGLGNDQIIARGNTAGAAMPAAAAQQDTMTGHDLWNDGIIWMGRGSDMLDAQPLGFTGSGTVKLGAGHDDLKGFGTGTFVGGRGLDTLTFNSGTYAISANPDGTYLIAGTMLVKGFESFGAGASISSFAAAAAAGSITFA